MKCLLCLLVFLMAVYLGGCGNNLSVPASPGPSWTLTSPLIQASFYSLEGNPVLTLNIADASGPVTNAAVTYMGPGVSGTNVPYAISTPIPVSYQGSTNTINVGLY